MSLDTFTNREYAVGVWIAFALVWVFTQPKMRSALASLIGAFLAWKLLVIQGFMIAYTALLTYALHEVGLWAGDMLKDTVYWYLGTAFVMVMHHTEAYSDPRYFRSMAVRTLELGVFLGFVTDFYAFSLPVEMVLIPFFAFVGGMIAVAGTDAKYAQTKKVLDGALLIVALGMFLYAVRSAIIDFANFATLSTLKGLVLPVILTVLFLPFMYLLALFSRYETLFVHIDVMVSKKSVEAASYLKKRIFLHCFLRLKTLSAFVEQSRGRLWSVATVDDAARLIESFGNGTLAEENARDLADLT